MKLNLPADPVIEAYKADVDMTLVRKSLQMTVQERVERLIALQAAAEEFRAAGIRLRRSRQED